jgi:hypothetical protein
MLAPENLSVKKIAGEEMTGEKLYWHMHFYLKLFQSNKLPTAKSIYESTVAKFLQDLVSQCVVMYKEFMTNGTDTVETHNGFNILHLDSKNKTIDFYNNAKKIGDNERIIYYRNALINEMEILQAEQSDNVLENRKQNEGQRIRSTKERNPARIK